MQNKATDSPNPSVGSTFDLSNHQKFDPNQPKPDEQSTSQVEAEQLAKSVKLPANKSVENIDILLNVHFLTRREANRRIIDSLPK